MDHSKISRLISITLNGPNYIHCALAMTSYLQARRVWHIITKEATVLVQKKDKYDEDFAERKEKWIRKNGDIITWCCNISIPTISQ